MGIILWISQGNFDLVDMARQLLSILGRGEHGNTDVMDLAGQLLSDLGRGWQAQGNSDKVDLARLL